MLYIHGCVKSSYGAANDGPYEAIWNDRGSGAKRDVSFYANTNIDSDVGLDSRCFTAFTTHRGAHTYGWPNLLRSETAKARNVILDTTYDQVALIAYQITNTERIWKDSGSGTDRDFSSHRVIESKDTCSLGDIGLDSYSSPSYGITVKEVKSSALAALIRY